MVDFQERRVCPRAKFSGITLLHAGRWEIPCLAGNVSESGMLLYPQQLSGQPASSVKVTFALPSTSRWIELEGRVVRQSSVRRRRAWGIQFVDVPTEEQVLLRDFVATQQPHGWTPPQGWAVPGLDDTASSYRPDPTPTPRHQRITAPLRPLARADEPVTAEVPQLFPADATTESALPPTDESPTLASASEHPRVPSLPDLPAPPSIELSAEEQTAEHPADELERLAAAVERPDPTRRTAVEEADALRAKCRSN